MTFKLEVSELNGYKAIEDLKTGHDRHVAALAAANTNIYAQIETLRQAWWAAIEQKLKLDPEKDWQLNLDTGVIAEMEAGSANEQARPSEQTEGSANDKANSDL